MARAGESTLKIDNLVGCHLIDIWILVCAKEYIFATSHIDVTFLGTFTNCLLHFSGIAESKETTLVLDIDKELPCFLGNSHSDGLHIVGTTGWVDHFIKVAFFLKEMLLIAGYALREFIWSLIGGVKRSDSY